MYCKTRDFGTNEMDIARTVITCLSMPWACEESLVEHDVTDFSDAGSHENTDTDIPASADVPAYADDRAMQIAM